MKMRFVDWAGGRRLALVVILLGVVVAGCGSLRDGGWHRMLGKKAKVEVIAHRGYSAVAPENTLAAFRAASEVGADWFELDCSFSKDRKMIVIHDTNLERTTNGKGPVADRTLAELKKLDAGSWFGKSFAGERLPTLGEALDLAQSRGIGVLIEIKGLDADGALNAQLLQQFRDVPRLDAAQLAQVAEAMAASRSLNLEQARSVVAEVRARQMAEHVVIQSFSALVCAAVLHEAPEMRVALLGSRDEKKPQVLADFLRWGELLDVESMNAASDAIDRDFLETCHRRGQKVAAWTVDDPDEMAKLVALGVDAIITNRPDLCLRVLGRQ